MHAMPSTHDNNNHHHLMIMKPSTVPQAVSLSSSSSSSSDSMLMRINWLDDSDSDNDSVDDMECQHASLSSSVTTDVASSSSSLTLQRFEDCYDKQHLLGQGGFAQVFQCRRRNNNSKTSSTTSSFAVKELIHSAYQRRGQDWSHEVNIMKQLIHGPHIVQLVDVFCQPQADRTYLVMPELQGGDLLDKLDERGCFSEQEAATIGRSLLQALYYCHARGIAHRDIKPENILLVTKDSSTHIRLADWGCAKQSFTSMATTTTSGYGFCKTLVGTPLYRAPEMLLSRGSSKYKNNATTQSSSSFYDERCDLWSAGVVFFALLGGYAPFDAPDDQVHHLIRQGHFEFHAESWSHISQAPKDLIASLLVVNPKERATIRQALTSSWLLSGCQPIEIENDDDDNDDSLYNSSSSFDNSMEFHDSGIVVSMD